MLGLEHGIKQKAVQSPKALIIWKVIKIREGRRYGQKKVLRLIHLSLQRVLVLWIAPVPQLSNVAVTRKVAVLRIKPGRYHLKKRYFISMKCQFSR